MNLSVVVPTYRRERVLVETVRALLEMEPPASEILVVDQSPGHLPETDSDLSDLAHRSAIRWIRLARPSIPHAMNVGLEEARGDLVLFLDDDIVPAPDLAGAHVRAHASASRSVVAGQVLQPGEEPVSIEEGAPFRFCSTKNRRIDEFMGGNFSVHRNEALALGGFDENFVRAAYRFERDFADRVLRFGGEIVFEPSASIRHLKAREGGTRSFGDHLTTLTGGQSVGAFYHLFVSEKPRRWPRGIAARMFESIHTRHHLRRPWWIPLTLIAEFQGMMWAAALFARGPRLRRTGMNEEKC